MANSFEMSFDRVQIEEEFTDDDGVQYEKLSPTSAEVTNGRGYRKLGEEVSFLGSDLVTLLT